MNYEGGKVNDLLINKNLNKYFIEILPLNYNYFSKLALPDELIFEILEQNNLSCKVIIGALSYVQSVEKVLFIINKYCEKISNCFIKENKNNKIYLSEIVNDKKTDNLNEIINEIKKILNYQLNSKNIFISFDKEFWDYYIQYNNKENNLKNLVLINKTLLFCKEVDKNFNPDISEIKMKIHKTGLSFIEKGKIKNEELIEFIENEDIYFKDQKYESNSFRPLEILKGIDLEKADDKFFEVWNKSNIFEIFSFNEYEFKKELINLIDDIYDTSKLLKLFRLLKYKDKKIFDNTTKELLYDKFSKKKGNNIENNNSKDEIINDFIKRLLKQSQQTSTTQNDESESSEEIGCGVCYCDSNDSTVIFEVAKCNHYLCSDCWKKIEKNGEAECPFCRQISKKEERRTIKI